MYLYIIVRNLWEHSSVVQSAVRKTRKWRSSGRGGEEAVVEWGAEAMLPPLKIKKEIQILPRYLCVLFINSFSRAVKINVLCTANSS